MSDNAQMIIELLEYFEQRVDAEQFIDQAAPVPSEEMKMLQHVEHLSDLLAASRTQSDGGEAVAVGEIVQVSRDSTVSCIYENARVDRGDLLYTHPPAANQGEWVKCSERLPTEADADCDGDIWMYETSSRNDGSVFKRLWSSMGPSYLYTHWMPTGLKRPNPPQQQEKGDE